RGVASDRRRRARPDDAIRPAGVDRSVRHLYGRAMADVDRPEGAASAGAAKPVLVLSGARRRFPAGPDFVNRCGVFDPAARQDWTSIRGIGQGDTRLIIGLRTAGLIPDHPAVIEMGAQQLANSFLGAPADIAALGRLFGVTEPFLRAAPR